MKTYILSWHYKFIVVPIIISLATAASIGQTPDLIELLIGKDIFNLVALIECFGILITTVLLWYAVLVIPYKIAIHSDGRIGFRCLIKQKIVLASQIQKIEHRFYTSKIYHREGNIYLTNLMNEFNSIGGTIKALNPKVEIENGA